MTYALMAVGEFVVLIIVVLNLMATVSLIRTSSLTRFQKIAQAVIVWAAPFVGASLVLHLMGQSDRASIPRWISNDAINDYVFQSLGIESKMAMRAAEHVVEQTIIDSMSEHVSHSGGGESAGSDGGH